MKEGRKEVLKTKSEIRKLALRRTVISIIIMDIMAAVMFYFMLQSFVVEEQGKALWQLYAWIICIMDIIFIYFFYYMAKQEFEAKNSKTFVKMYLPHGESVEVIPIKVDRYSDFIFGLAEVSKFYATTNKKGNIIEINLKLNNEKESRYFEQIRSTDFTEYYKIKSEKQEEEKG